MNSPRIYAIHDQAITIEIGNEINEAINLEVLNLKQDFEATPFEGFIECVPAYSSLTIYFDDNRTLEEIRKEIKSRLEKKNLSTNKSTLIETTLGSTINIKPIIIPVCYDVEYGTDLNWLSNHLGLSIDEIISLHTESFFRVYMMGFIPGFAYMGTLPEKLHAPRKQTGIYPAAVPGGWQIIGRTPHLMFDKKRNPCSLLKAGDAVQFKSISKKEFESAS